MTGDAMGAALPAMASHPTDIETVLPRLALACCAAIWMRKRDKQDENPVCRDRRRA
jgi:hypothetical protein